MRYLVILTIVFGCIPKSGSQKDLEELILATPSITIFYHNTKNGIYTVRKDQTFEERLKKSHYIDTLSGKYDTINFPLEENIQLIYAKTPLKFDEETILAKNGDTIKIEISADTTIITKLINNEKIAAHWFDTILLPSNNLQSDMAQMKSVFTIEKKVGNTSFLTPNYERKPDWETNKEKYTEIIDNYFGRLLDSLSLMEGEESNLYKGIIKRNHYFELYSLNNIVNDPGLSDRLNSEEFLSIKNFNNRYLTTIFTTHFHKNFAYNNDVSLAASLDEGFLDYPDEMRHFLKSQSIQLMIVKKYSRDVILKYVETYKDEYGSLVPLEPLLEEIDYGTIASQDLVLQDSLGHSIAWENLKKNWEGNLIYVDFWASWCAPCIQAIPYSKELKKQFENQEVIFVYLSFNDKEKPWKAMSQKHGIVKNNFLILNSRSSEFINLSSINKLNRIR